jgi:hypothetical protein
LAAQPAALVSAVRRISSRVMLLTSLYPTLLHQDRIFTI